MNATDRIPGRLEKCFHRTAPVCLYIVLTLLLLQSANAQVQGDDPGVRIDISAAISELRSMWTNGNISRVEVLHITTNATFRIAVSSSRLESAYDRKLIVQHFSETNEFQQLVAVIGNLRSSPSGKRSDLRWGYVFYDQSDHKVFGVYFDATGRKGVINGCCVDFHSDALLTWSLSNFGSIFR